MILKKEPIRVCDHGTATQKEDALMENYPFYVVIDAFSEPYSPKMPQILFNGLTGGEIICRIVAQGFSLIRPEYILNPLIAGINISVSNQFRAKGMPVDDSGCIPGASFIFAKIEEEKKLIRLIQGGDCLGFWLLKSGGIGFTRDQAYGHVSKNLLTIRQLRKKGLSIGEMWNVFAPILAERRRRDINKKTKQGYASLNGQIEVGYSWQRIDLSTDELDTLILLSDGYFQNEEGSLKNIPALAERIIKEYQTLGLKEMLEKKRRKEARNSDPSYITHDEATAIALEF
jgi:hypothetical protein